MEFPFMEVVVGFMVLIYIFETYLHWRQHAAYKLLKLPEALQGVFSQTTVDKSRAYCIDRSHFRFVYRTVDLLIDIAFLFFFFPWFWKITEGFLVHDSLDLRNEFVHTLVFLAVLLTCSEIISLPFSLYSTFVIEARHNFNKQTLRLFIGDACKRIVIFILIGPPIILAIIVIVQKGGPYVVLYLWAFVFVSVLGMMTLYPTLIAPLFNKFTPLPNGVLREKIENLASSLEFPLTKLFVVDGSKRSGHSNAYMYGFFKNKRIVLYDTLIQQCNDDEEIVAVLAHELGHWKLNHVIYGLAAFQIFIMLQFGGYAFARNSKDLFQSFGFETQPVVIGLIIFQYVMIPVQRLFNFGSNLVSRRFEFQADAFACKLGYSSKIRASLIKLQEENLSAVNTDPWYCAYHYTHPPLIERLAAIDDYHLRTQDGTLATSDSRQHRRTNSPSTTHEVEIPANQLKQKCQETAFYKSGS